MRNLTSKILFIKFAFIFYKDPRLSIKRTHGQKAKGSGFEGRRWQWVGQGAEVGWKWRQLYLNNNKIIIIIIIIIIIKRVNHMTVLQCKKLWRSEDVIPTIISPSERCLRNHDKSQAYKDQMTRLLLSRKLEVEPRLTPGAPGCTHHLLS